MDNRYDNRIKRKRRVQRAEALFRKNGLYAALVLCLALIGAIAAGIFASGGSKVEHNLDQRLSDVQKLTAAPTAKPAETPSKTAIPAVGTETPRRTPVPTPVPDFTPAPSAKPAEPSENPMLSSPADGSVIRVFAMDCLIYSKTLNQWMTHPGVDIACPKGAEVRCVAAGTVERVYTDDMLGVTVVIAHDNGMSTVYSNLKEQPPVTEGQSVESRALIGYIGDTALSECAEQAHLHFELRVDGVPQDPAKFVLFPSMPE